MHRIRRRKDLGQALPLVAVTMVVLLGCAALAVDVGFALTARSEAQRISDSSSLAGASIFLEEDGLDAVPEGLRRAKEYAARNAVRGSPVDTTLVSSSSFFNDDGFEVFEDVTEGMTVQVIPGEYKVRVWVSRSGLSTWFARVLGVDQLSVRTLSAAVASEGGSSDQCVLPFAMPDLWDDNNDDANGNGLPDDGENWEFDDGDDYRPWDGTFDEGIDNGIGYGSNWRDRNGTDDDIGTRIWIKTGPPGRGGGGSGGDAGGTDDMVAPGNFQLWQMPDPDDDCQPRSGANWLTQNIATCNSCPIGVGELYPQETQTGNMASIKDDIEDLIEQDPNAEFDPETGEIVNSDFENPLASPRVRIVPIWSPTLDLQGQSTFYFNNFARIFLEGGSNPPDFPIYARFLGTITGGPGGPTTGPLVRYLRLVE